MIAFFVGPGFCGGMEIMQYFAAFGNKFIIAAFVACVMLCYYSFSLARAGNENRFDTPEDVFVWYCGKRVGRFYIFFSTLVCILGFVMMCGSAGSVLAQQFGLPSFVGTVLVGALVLVSVLSGIKKVSATVAKLGPVIIVCVITIAVITIIRGGAGISGGISAVSAGEVAISSASSSPVVSAASYAGCVLIWFVSYMSDIGSKHNLKTLSKGIAAGSGAIFLAIILSCLALFSSAAEVNAADIPNLLLAGKIAPLLSYVYALIILCGSYSASIPLVWTASSRISKGNTRKFRLATAAIVIVCTVAAAALPYRALVKWILSSCGYFGIALFCVMVVKDVRGLRRKKQKALKPAKTI